MITEGIINVLFLIAHGALSIIPLPEINAAGDIMTTFIQWIKVACYLLPMETIGLMIGVILIIYQLRYTVTIIRTIWDLLPVL